MQRQFLLPRPSSTQRHFLDESRRGSLDVLLKNLKLGSRSLQVALATLKEEHQILERIYYKGKNQHRAALFWRRVVEIRRYCSRVDGIRIVSLIDALKSSFFGEGACNNPKVTKGPWTHYPDITYIKMILQRVSSFHLLITKMHTKLEGAYELLTLAMQPGAFLQIMLMLTAIVSRLAAISLELREALALTSKTIESIYVLFQNNSFIVSEAVNILADPSLDITLSNGSREPPLPPEATHLQDMVTFLPSEPLGPRIVIEEKMIKDNPSKDRAKHLALLKKRKPWTDEIDDIFGL